LEQSISNAFVSRLPDRFGLHFFILLNLYDPKRCQLSVQSFFKPRSSLANPRLFSAVSSKLFA
jgi:hypothetical protein